MRYERVGGLAAKSRSGMDQAIAVTDGIAIEFDFAYILLLFDSVHLLSSKLLFLKASGRHIAFFFRMRRGHNSRSTKSKQSDDGIGDTLV